MNKKFTYTFNPYNKATANKRTMKIIFMFCFIVLTAAKKETPITLCGRQLANARVLVCYGPEFLNTNKRTPEALLDLLASDKWDDDWPWTGRRGGLTADWTRYKRNGLADECCLKPCTTDVILSYC